MKTITLYQRISILIALISLSLLYFVKVEFKEIDATEVVEELKVQLTELETQSDQFFKSNADSLFQSPNPWSSVLQNELTLAGWELFMFELDELVCWSSNEFSVDSSIIASSGWKLNNSEFGWNFINVYRNETSSLTAVYPLYRKGTAMVAEINHLPEGVILEQDFDLDAGLQEAPLENLKVVAPSREGFHILEWIFIITFLLSSFLAMTSLLRRGAWWAMVFPILLLLVRIALYHNVVLEQLQSYELFNPGIYASSFLLPSLGDLVLHSVVALALALGLNASLRDFNISLPSVLKWIIAFIAFSVSIFTADLQYGIVEGLVLDSNISYDILNLQTINQYSIIAICLIALNACSWLMITRVLLKLVQPKDMKLGHIAVLSIAGIAFFYIFQHFDARREIDTLLPAIAGFILLVLWLVYIDLYKWKNLLVLTLTVSILASISIRKFDRQRDSEHLKFHASKLVSEKDLGAEYQFEQIETKLVSEFLNPQNFEELNKNKDAFEKRLRHLYFASSLNQYEVKLLSFDSDDRSIDTFSLFTFDALEEIYNNAYPTISRYFYQIKKPSETNGYIARFENCNQEGHFGNVFLLLEPKVIQSTYVYPPLLQKKNRRPFFNINDYSFAIYDEGKLIKKKGDVAYELRYNADQLQNSSFFGGAYSHFISAETANTSVVLSTKNSAGLKFISTVSFTFLFYSFIILVLLILFMALQLGLPYLLTKNENIRLSIQDRFSSLLGALGLGQKLLSVRIQLIMAGLIFAGLMASVLFTIKYLEVNHNQRSREELSLKINEVVNQIQNQPNLEQKLAGEETAILLASEVSDIHKVEANLFNNQGDLLASSKPEIYDQALFSRTMDAKAFYQMNVVQVSQLIHNEGLRGFDYLSAYMPLFNEKHSIIGYINLPYFIGQTKLNKEISTYTITFVNLYLLLFGFALALAYVVSKRITRPLKIIQEKISTTALGTENETIEWKGSDEIGQLIKQYNKMVLELESSAERLSASEREGAWKEMARQVAHEIKNPLTPMKLNIQHLQRAWKDDNPKLEETFKKVTKVLIDQIESLSRLASEFSSFAQMPADDFSTFNVHELLYDVLVLFEKSENIKFIYQKEVLDLFVYGDKEQVQRAFNNIIKNAIQAIPPDRSGIIVAEIEQKGQNVYISIKDNGAGIDPKTAEQIFVPKFSTKTSGMGLGLAITKKIIENNGGSISFESKLDKGTTFFIKFPLKSDENAN